MAQCSADPSTSQPSPIARPTRFRSCSQHQLSRAIFPPFPLSSVRKYRLAMIHQFAIYNGLTVER